MPPNADVSRLRNRFANDLKEDDHGLDPATQSTRTEVLKNLSQDEVAIDGIIYTLDGFKHPGGDSIKIFGGNDVTVQYKMIHPYHTKKHLEKMQVVGQVVDYKPE